ncbi:S9 family peptidase [Alishewanella tabrizica]|uniref:Acyl-peptide hydrolase n=1 Tax=Alishewanella tabrizica TaxID=671278 RepID=A0ABQ2WH61_9ALTE|nr:S9 family peptidase [Alishewanella tabrizica]GGW56079.1 acyl-peptide hydrolase [Alishewanella tabrizica]
MKFLALGALAAVMGFSPLLHAASVTTPFQADDIFKLAATNDVQISPDGKHIVYVRQQNDIMTDRTQSSLWLIEVATGQHYPLFADKFSYSQPRWAPDNNRIAFVSDRDGSSQIYVHWLKEQKTAAISQTQWRPGQLSWSPNGKHIAFSAEVTAATTDFAKSVYQPKKPAGANWSASPIVVERTYYQADGRGVMRSAYNQLFIVPAEGGIEQQLTDGPYAHRGPLVWTQDSQALIFSANRHAEWEYQPNQADLYQVSINGQQLTQLTQLDGQESEPTLSPDGKTVAFTFTSPAAVSYSNSKLKLLSLASGEISALAADLDRSVESPSWVNNSTLVFQYADQGKTKVAQITTRDRRTDLVDDLGGTSLGRPYLSGMYSVAENGTLAYTQGTSQRPADVAVYSNKRSRTLTSLNSGLLDQRKLGEVHEIRYTSTAGNEEIHAWYITPPDFDPTKKYPLILEIHGGPHLAYGPQFAAELQRYAAEGYVVLYNNYRGSTSYGERFAMLLHYNYASEHDFKDHMSGVDAMLAKGFIDENNLFIAGGSAGGIGSLYAVGLTKRFNAAAATNPVVNWTSKVLAADSYVGQIQNQFPGTPWEHQAHYWQRSPLSLVGNVSTPVLLFTGEKDRRTPMAETEQYYQALKLQKVDTAMVRVPDAYHGVTNRPSWMIAKVEYALAWFKRYKKDAE